MKVSIFFILFLFRCSFIFAQTYLHGIVVDNEDNKPVPYTTIGLINRARGTVSNVDGKFSIDLGVKIGDNDTLRFSSVGYQTRDFLVRDLNKSLSTPQLVIALKKSITELKPVIVSSTHAHIKILGYETTSKLLGLGFGTNSIGSQGGVRLQVNHKNTNIENLSFFIIQNSFESLTFRINIYEMNGGKPGDNILNSNIIVKILNKQTGKITVDLASYKVYVDKDALITLEWIEAKPATIGTLDIAAVLFGSTYFREASQYVWRKKGTGLGISVKTNY